MNGVLYVAFGETYQAEAIQSLASLKRVSPDIRTCVVTNESWDIHPLPDQFTIREPIFSFECKPRYIFDDSPFDNTLYLDTDTYVARDISKAFNLLNYYDIGVNFGGSQLNVSGIECHTQCSSSTILFKKNDSVQNVFENWRILYEKAKKKSQTLGKDSKNIGDQRYLSIAIAKSKARPVSLASYFNFILCGECTTNQPPYIYTGRNVDYRWADYSLTRGWDTSQDWWGRTWMQNIKGVFPRGVRRSDPLLALALISRRLYNELRQFLWMVHNGRN